MVNVALLVRLQAKPGKEEEVEKFLQDCVSVVEGELGRSDGLPSNSAHPRSAFSTRSPTMTRGRRI